MYMHTDRNAAMDIEMDKDMEIDMGARTWT
jgi:hypothetical protein